MLSFLAQELRQFSDPRIQYVTLTAVDMSPDLKNAKVYWSALPLGAGGDALPPSELKQENITEIQTLLKRSVGYLKKRIGAELQLRWTPELHFHYDESLARGSRIEELLSKV